MNKLIVMVVDTSQKSLIIMAILIYPLVEQGRLFILKISLMVIITMLKVKQIIVMSTVMTAIIILIFQE